MSDIRDQKALEQEQRIWENTYAASFTAMYIRYDFKWSDQAAEYAVLTANRAVEQFRNLKLIK